MTIIIFLFIILVQYFVCQELELVDYKDLNIFKEDEYYNPIRRRFILNPTLNDNHYKVFSDTVYFKSKVNYLEPVKFIKTVNSDLLKLINKSNKEYKLNQLQTNPKNDRYVRTWLRILDTFTKEAVENYMFENPANQIPQKNDFWVMIENRRIQIFFEKTMLKGAFYMYNICDIEHIQTYYTPDHIYNDLEADKCITLFISTDPKYRTMIFCFYAEQTKYQFLQALRELKNECLPHTRVLPKQSVDILQNYVNFVPLVKCNFWFKPYYDKILSNNMVLTFYLDSERIFYETRSNIFKKNIEPTEMLFSDILDPINDYEDKCCDGITIFDSQIGEYNSCLHIKHHSLNMQWEICSMSDKQRDKFKYQMELLMKDKLTKLKIDNNRQLDTMLGHEMKQLQQHAFNQTWLYLQRNDDSPCLNAQLDAGDFYRDSVIEQMIERQKIVVQTKKGQIKNKIIIQDSLKKQNQKIQTKILFDLFIQNIESLFSIPQVDFVDGEEEEKEEEEEKAQDVQQKSKIQ